MTSETTREQVVEAAKRLADICKTECDHTVCVLCRYALQPTPPRDEAWCREFVERVLSAGIAAGITSVTGSEKAAIEFRNDRAGKYVAELSARWPGATGYRAAELACAKKVVQVCDSEDGPSPSIGWWKYFAERMARAILSPGIDEGREGDESKKEEVRKNFNQFMNQNDS